MQDKEVEKKNISRFVFNTLVEVAHNEGKLIWMRFNLYVLISGIFHTLLAESLSKSNVSGWHVSIVLLISIGFSVYWYLLINIGIRYYNKVMSTIESFDRVDGAEENPYIDLHRDEPFRQKRGSGTFKMLNGFIFSVIILDFSVILYVNSNFSPL